MLNIWVFFFLFANSNLMLNSQLQAIDINDSVKYDSSSPAFVEEQGVSNLDLENEIIVGQTGMFFGHFTHYARSIQNGIKAAFNRANMNGGISGKKLRLISMEDYGNPETALKNVEYLLYKHKANFFLGNMGTRAILNLLPLVKQESIALLFPWGGDSQLKDPTLGTVVNGPGFLEPQLRDLVTYAQKNLKTNKIAIFHADDSFSRSAASKLTEYIKQQGIVPLMDAEYNRFTMNIIPAAKSLIEVDPKIVFCISTSTPTVKLINYFFRKGYFGTVFLGIDSTEFARYILAPKGVKFYCSAAVPNPLSNFDITKNYRRDIEDLLQDKEFNTLSLTYYLSATIFIKALQSIGYPCTPRNLVKKIEEMKNIDLGGIFISFNEKNRHIFGESTYIIQD